MKPIYRTIATAMLLFALPIIALAAGDYPTKPIKLIVPNGAGGSTDLTARLLADPLSRILGQGIAVVNVPGGGTAIGAQEAARSKPDGYTLLLTHEALLTSSAMGANKLGPGSLVAIAQTGTEVNVLLVRKDSPITSLQDFYKRAAAGHAGDKLKLGINPGAANHFAFLQILSPVKSDVIFVPTGGGGPTLKALLGGHIDVSADVPSESNEYIRAGQLKALSVFAAKRDADMPNVPTAGELGFPLEVGLHYVWYAPKGTPPERLKVLADALSRTMTEPATRKALHNHSITTDFQSGDALREALDKRYANITELAKPYLTAK